MLIVFYMYTIRKKTNNKQSDKDIFSENELLFLKQLCKNLLQSEFFYYFENVVVYHGKVVKLRYFGSFEVNDDMMSNTFKIMPKNRTGSFRF